MISRFLRPTSSARPHSAPPSPRRAERGATAAEYGIIIALVGLALAIALIAFRGQIASMLEKAGACISSGSC